MSHPAQTSWAASGCGTVIVAGPSTRSLERMNSRAVCTSSLLVRALLAYSVHEHEVGTAKRVRLELRRRSFTVEDDGRGLGLDRDGYVVGMLEQLTGRGGEVVLHGIGLAIVAMSSQMLSIESRRGGLLSTQAYSLGIAQGPVQSRPAGSERGTRVIVTLSSDAPDIECDEVLAQVEAWRATHPNLRIEVVIDENHAL
jgi:DNA gyrase/topoisomerase IV subunit B